MARFTVLSTLLSKIIGFRICIPLKSLLCCLLCILLVLPGRSAQIQAQPSERIDSLRNLLLSSRQDLSRQAGLYFQIGQAFRQSMLLDTAMYYFRLADSLFTSQAQTRDAVKAGMGIVEVYLAQGNNRSALELLLTKLSVVNALKDPEISAQTYNHLGRTCNQLGDFEKGIEYYTEALRWSAEAGLTKLKASTHYGMGMNYYGRGDFPGALQHFESALSLYKELNLSGAVATTCAAMGNIYYDQGLYSRALQMHLNALITNEAVNNTSGMASNYSNIANVYFIQDSFTAALTFQSRSLDMHRVIGNKTGMATNYYNLALIYDKLHQHDTALTAQLQSLALHEETGDKAGSVFCLKHLGDLYSGIEPDTAASYYLRAISASREIGDQVNLSRSLLGMGALQLQMHQLKAARHHIEEGLSLARVLGLKESIRDGYLFLMKTDSLAGNYRQALEHYHHYTLYRDSLQAEGNHQLTRDLQARYETEKKDQAIALLHQESHLQKMKIKQQKDVRNAMAGGTVLVLVMSFLVYYSYMTRQKLKLQVLRNKIASDLHDDVGSTLSSISIFSAMARQQSNDVIPLLDTIQDCANKMLDAMGDIVWSIHPENDQFEKIIMRMQNFAFDLLGARNIEFEFTTSDELATLKLPMEVRKNIYLIFKEATNNLVKYADAEKASFLLQEENKILSLMVRDNGKGFDVGHTAAGNGLKNMHKRAGEIGGQLTIDSAPGTGTTILLKVAV